MEPSSKECYLFSDDYRTGSNPFYDTKSVKSKEKIGNFLLYRQIQRKLLFYSQLLARARVQFRDEQNTTLSPFYQFFLK